LFSLLASRNDEHTHCFTPCYSPQRNIFVRPKQDVLPSKVKSQGDISKDFGTSSLKLFGRPTEIMIRIPPKSFIESTDVA